MWDDDNNNNNNNKTLCSLFAKSHGGLLTGLGNVFSLTVCDVSELDVCGVGSVGA